MVNQQKKRRVSGDSAQQQRGGRLIHARALITPERCLMGKPPHYFYMKQNQQLHQWCKFKKKTPINKSQQPLSLIKALQSSYA